MTRYSYRPDAYPFSSPSASHRRNPGTGEEEATGKMFVEFVHADYQGTRQVADKKTGRLKTLQNLSVRKVK